MRLIHAWHTLVFAGILLLLNMGSTFAAPKDAVVPNVEMQWSIEETAGQNNIEAGSLLKALAIEDTRANRLAPLTAFNLSEEQVAAALRKAIALKNEESSKNWRLILLKFSLWWLFIAIGIRLLMRKWITPSRRNALLLLAVVVFGVLLGSDPSPMGTVKDTIVLYGVERVVFPPRLVAFGVFTLMVIVGNKMICGWGCQFGALQDLIGQLSPFKNKIRIPFKWSQRVRVAVFVAFTAIAFAFAFDVIGSIDPFKIYTPSHLTIFGGGAVLVLLLLSLITYRPWCTFACPFGLTGWFFERFSFYRIRWNSKKCIACGNCERVCPSQHMIGLLADERHPADCYSCGACIKACPADALRYDKKSEG